MCNSLFSRWNLAAAHPVPGVSQVVFSSRRKRSGACRLPSTASRLARKSECCTERKILRQLSLRWCSPIPCTVSSSRGAQGTSFSISMDVCAEHRKRSKSPSKALPFLTKLRYLSDRGDKNTPAKEGRVGDKNSFFLRFIVDVLIFLLSSVLILFFTKLRSPSEREDWPSPNGVFFTPSKVCPI